MCTVRFISSAACGLVLPLALAAQSVPTTVNFQGRLTDNSPSQVPVNTTVPMAFAIWDDPAAGTKLWQEPASGGTSVLVVNGIFNVALGGNGVPLPASVFSGATSVRYLEIILNPGAGNQEILAPRQRLSTTGYAARAQASVDSDALGGAIAGSWQRSLISSCQNTEFLVGFTQGGSPICSTPDNASGNWRITGNAGTVPGGHFIGTTDGQRLVFKTGGYPWMTLSEMGDLGIGYGGIPAQSRLHLAGGSGAVNALFTNTNSGSTVNDGLLLGFDAGGNSHLHHQEPVGTFKLQYAGLDVLNVGSGGHVGIHIPPDPVSVFAVADGAGKPALATFADGIRLGDVNGLSFGNYQLIDFETTPRFLFMNANIGVGTATPGEQLDIASGNVRINPANDYKYSGAKTHYYAVQAAAFNPEASGYARALISGNVYLATGSAVTVGYVIAPVNLPDGATVTALSCYVVDNDGTYNPQACVLWRVDSSTSSSYGNSQTMATTPTPASTNSTLIQLCTTSTVSNATIDNQNYSYFLRWGTQQLNSNLRLNRMVITYTVTKAD